MHYEDSTMAVSDDTLTIKHYWFPGKDRRIRLGDIVAVTERTDRRWRWRLIGTGDFRQWLSWDRTRHRKPRALVIHLDGHWRPVITPEDPAAALAALTAAVPTR